MAYTPCYRREAGSAGRDTRGLLRTHEFDKVEILAYTTPEQAPDMLDELLGRAESTIAALRLPYRILDICTGDLGQSHHRSFDIEVFLPGLDQWLEVSSVSWFSDYQARRANIRYRPAGRKGTELVHTLNGSALAVPRVWAAILEVHRQPDGSVAIPEVLWPYTRGHRASSVVALLTRPRRSPRASRHRSAALSTFVPGTTRPSVPGCSSPQRPDRVDRVGLVGVLVVPVAHHPGEAQGDAARVAG